MIKTSRFALCIICGVMISAIEAQFFGAGIFSLPFMIAAMLTVPAVFLYSHTNRRTAIVFAYTAALTLLLDILDNGAPVPILLVCLSALALLYAQPKIDSHFLTVFVCCLLAAASAFGVYSGLQTLRLPENEKISLFYSEPVAEKPPQTEQDPNAPPVESDAQSVGNEGEAASPKQPKEPLNVWLIVLIVLTAVVLVFIAAAVYRYIRYRLWLRKTLAAAPEIQVYELYLRILRALSICGYPRNAGDTPLEYLKIAETDGFPLPAAQFSDVTQSMMASHFGKREVSADECDNCVALYSSLPRVVKRTKGRRFYYLRYLRRAFAIALTLIIALTPLTSLALDDNEFGGYASDTLSIMVGYPDGPNYEKYTFTLSELEGMDVVCADYTFIDNMPSVIIAHVRGVRLSDIITAAGVDIGSVRKLHFWIRDKSEASYTSFTKSELFDTPRYCYYSLPDNFNYDEGVGNEYATSDGVLVEPMLALADDWNRALAGATFGSDYLNLNTNTRFRLVFGQTNATTRTASRSAKWVYSIVLELRGTPGVTLDVSELALLTDAEYQVTATCDAADPVIIENTSVVWTSDNERVATVDETGKITTHNSGTTVITAEFLGATASVTVTVAEPDTEAPLQTGAPGGTGADTNAGTGTKPPVEVTPSDEPPKPTPNETPSPSPSETPPIPSKTPAPPSPETPESTPLPESPKTELPPDETMRESPMLPIIGIAAIGLFSGGAVVTEVRDRIKSKKRDEDA